MTQIVTRYRRRVLESSSRNTRMILFPLVLFALVACTSGFRSVCYYTNWAQYRHGKGTFYPENINPALCTHLIYAFAKPQGLDIVAFEWNDESTQWSTGMYERTMALKSKNPSLQILLAVGGYNMGSQPFVPIVDTPNSRATFAQNAIKFLRAKGFDGLDMDWEYPGSRGSTATDKQKLVLFMQEMMRAFEVEAQTSGKPRLLLTGALPAGKDTIDAGFDVVPLLSFMDFASVMTYDLHGSWEPYTGINSPLYANPRDVGKDAYLNLHWVAQYYVSLGAPKDKLNIGIALYGRTFLLDNPSQHDVGSPAGQPGDAGLFTSERGFIAYYEICDLINAGATIVDVPSQRNRYLYSGRNWVGYDDLQSVTEKACYTKEHGFGGVMFWAPDLDDFLGQTCKQGTYPLITAVITEMQNPSLANCAEPPSHVTTNVTQAPATGSPSPATPSIVESNNFDCTNKADDFYPDPDSCDHFYICVHQVSYKSHCGTGLLFNPDRKHCEYDYLTTCNVPGGSPATTQRPVVTEATTDPTTISNTICASTPNSAIAHPSDCHKFYLCFDGEAEVVTCMGDMVFNPSKGSCDFSTCTITPGSG
ncbi:hypothetical protein BsWGS_06615 [Bradybaena similaris]